MKYYFEVSREEDQKPIIEDNIKKFHPILNEKQMVFEAEINADEMVELMEHLWNIANRRKY